MPGLVEDVSEAEYKDTEESVNALNGGDKCVDGNQQHARRIRIIGQLRFWCGIFILPRTILSR